jgi:hypothetical protein
MSGEVCGDELEGIHCTLANAILAMTKEVGDDGGRERRAEA